MKQEELNKTLDLHKKWLNGDSDGVRAYLRGANLSGAYLRGANLCGANLREADLRGADLRGGVGYIAGPHRSDGHRFDLRMIEGSWRVVAGCNTWNTWTTNEYRDHASKYDDPDKRAETLAILDYLDVRAKQEDAA